MPRRFIDALQDVRCKHDVMLRDKSLAQCGRRVMEGRTLCWQHARIDCACDVCLRDLELNRTTTPTP